VTGSDGITSGTRLGRAVIYLHQQQGALPPVVAAQLEVLLLTGRAMDFAARLQGHTGAAASGLTPALARSYAGLAGLGGLELLNTALPALKRADVVDFAAADSELTFIEEYVGVTGSVLQQTLRVLERLGPSDDERAALHSIEIASWAPLTRAQHLDQLTRRGLTTQLAETGRRLAQAAGVNREVPSPELREPVVFNPYVWGSKQVPIAGFLRSLPSAERDALLGICQQALDRPGLALPGLTGSPGLITSARKVGLIQTATVKSTSAVGPQTYIFSPLLEADDDQMVSTEALHQRKLFVAHILFGGEKAQAGRGRIMMPTTLVAALLRNKVVGPVSNIVTDYHLAEAAGIVRVEETGNGRGLLHLVKEDIVRGGLDWLQASQGSAQGSDGLLLPKTAAPSSFDTPETDRRLLPDDAAANEITTAAILRLREEAQRAARRDDPF